LTQPTAAVRIRPDERGPGEAVNVEQLWHAFGRHGGILYAGSPRFVGRVEVRWFAILTGEPNLDLNIGGLHGAADAADAAALLAVVDGVGAPTVVPVSRSVGAPATDVLRAAGFQPLAAEAAMWRPPIAIAAAPGPFIVRRATDDADLADADRILAEAHGTAEGTVARVFNISAWRAGTLGCWVAREGADPVSSVWLTWDGGLVGVWEMMTSPRHRRRGAGRAVLTAALAETAALGVAGTLLWASPMGRPLYEALGFEVFDDVVPWVRGGTDEELALIGAAVQADMR
jgi:GNAT superfamily N-acetyltransferase